MERTRSPQFKLETFSCDLDLESAWLRYGFYIPSHYGEHLTNEYCFRREVDMQLIRNARFKQVTFKCDLYLELAWLSYKFCTASLLDEHLI